MSTNPDTTTSPKSPAAVNRVSNKENNSVESLTSKLESSINLSGAQAVETEEKEPNAG